VDGPHDLHVHYSQGYQHNNVTSRKVTVFKIDNKITKNATTNITPLGQATYRGKKIQRIPRRIEFVFSLVTMPEVHKFSKSTGDTSKFYASEG
jgi:hypothetical protein